MARLATSNNDKVYTINKWLGVNENPDGDTNLKMGEASTMTNFKITNDFALQKRPGTQNVANLLFNYDIDIGDEVAIQTEIYTTTVTYTLYPSIDITDGGILFVTGTPVTVNAATASSYGDYYWQSGTGNVYRFKECTYETHEDATHVTGGWVVYGTAGHFMGYASATINSYSSVSVSGGAVSMSGTYANGGVGRYTYNATNNNGTIYLITNIQPHPELPVYMYSGQAVSFHAADTWRWKFYPVTVVPNTTDSQMRGIWSGRVDGTEVICAACNNRLWQLSETDGVWTKEAVGFINTEKPVHFFGFDEKLYMLNGSEYKVWNGTDLTTVVGYRPLVAVASPYNGGGTALERINMLNGQRRVWFSPDGSHATFTLPEKGLASVDYAKTIATGAALTISSSDLTNGTTTLSANPTAGTDTVEIGYTVSTTLRSQVEAMTLSELFNGANDNRVFLYGDGSNKAFYSGLDYNGQATAEYFPDLNVVHVGDGNTPLYDLARHHKRLFAGKDGAAYIIKYGTITLETGVVTAGFYTEPINRSIGSSGYGQAQLVGNNMRTLDGRSIREWSAIDSSGNISDSQTNEQRISQKVDKTIREMDLQKAITFYDKINHEYFVVENGVAIVQNTQNGTWYIYRDFPAICMIVYKDELYFGTEDGFIRHVSRNYMHDIGQPITTYWESGSMSFGKDFITKHTDEVYIVPAPEDDVLVNVTILTDKKQDYEDEEIIPDATKVVGAGFFSFLKLNFAHFTFGINKQPKTHRKKIKAKGYTWMKLIFSSVTKDTKFTILSASINVRETGKVK